MREALFLAAYVGCLELGRMTTTAGGVTLVPVATGLLLFAFARANGPRLMHLLVGTLVVTGAWSGPLHHQDLATAAALACANAAGALAGARVLGRTAAEAGHGLRTVADAGLAICAALAGAAAAAAVVGIAGSLTGALVFHDVHVRLVTDLIGIFMVVPIMMAGRRGLVAALRGRRLELVVLLSSVGVATHFMWSGARPPWPGLLAPFFVWGVLRFPLASSLVNVAFMLTAVRHLIGGRTTPPLDAPTGLAGLWLYVIVSAAFLVMSAGVLERRRSQQLMARVLDGVSDGIIVLDTRGVVETMNRSAATMFGCDQDDAAGLPSGRLWSTAQGGADDATRDVTATRRDGSTFPARLSLSPVQTDDDRHTLAIVRDLSRQRQTEQSLAMSEAQWDAVVAALTDVIVIHDKEGRCLEAYVAPHAAPQVQGDRLTGHRVLDMLPPDEASPLEAVRERVIATKTPEVLEQRVTWNGQSTWVEARIVPLGDARTLSVIRDVTERHALHDRLRQAQRLEAIGRLAGGVAHDFNNLLTVIGGSTELALEALPASAPHRRALLEVRDATTRAALLTQQLLAFGRRQRLVAEVFDLGRVVLDCEQMLRRVIGEHIDLVCRVPDDERYVRADRGQIEQVIVNLAANARDAMPAGGRLTIDVDSVELTGGARRPAGTLPSDRFVRLSVADTGTGIPPAILEHIFEPFFTTKDTGRGTGLGLATVHGIVEQSGGYIAVDSLEGSGTTFTVHLPAAGAPEHVPPVTAPAATPDRSAGQTILLVEDEDGVREVASSFLSNAGYHVLSAAGAAAALELVRTYGGPVHVLLSDIVMPGLSGPAMARQIRAQHPAVRVLFMSGYPNDALSVHHVPEEPTAWIQKPFSAQSLVRAVRDLADRSTESPPYDALPSPGPGTVHAPLPAGSR
jgi:PAS domain S-box-containing protein